MPTKFKQHSPIVVQRIISQQWTYPIHNHDHFEIILVERGKGLHDINGKVVGYQEGSIFLLTPDDSHSFRIEEETSFLYIKFTEYFFHKDKDKQEKARWTHKMETILYQPNVIPGVITYDENDRAFILTLAKQIETEYSSDRCYSEDIMADCLGMIISIIARSICYIPDHQERAQANNSSKVNQIINHIRKSVYQASEVRIKNLADHFNMSENYISSYFKKQTGESLKTYILKYRLNLVMYRLKKSNDTISEIAYDLGFFDDSHLSRLFKQEFGVTPKEFRKG